MEKVPTTIYLPKDLYKEVRKYILEQKLQGNRTTSVSRLVSDLLHNFFNSNGTPQCFSQYDKKSQKCQTCTFKDKCKEAFYNTTS